MGDPDSRVRRVDRLSPGAGRAVDVDADIAGLDLDLDLVGLGQHVHRRGGGVDASLGLGDRDPLHPVSAGLLVQSLPRVLALDEKRDPADAPELRLSKVQHLWAPTSSVGITLVHVEEVLGEQVRLLSPLRSADLDDHVAPVVWVTGHQQVAQLRFECHDPCLCGTLLVTAELALCTDGFGRQLASDGDVGLRGLELVHLAYDGLELLVAARQRAQLIGILRERWVREACEDL